ncbi:MAG: hypothetical protein COB54_02860 [Alphaproteobacteria bacterium]|nr:MAG: hypothetical protein COB54_02860 [Alphaproteobacteria bacterium]
MVMRWKILELAERCTSLDDLLRELRKHPEYDLPEDGGVALLQEYSDILPEVLRDELLSRAKARDAPKRPG